MTVPRTCLAAASLGDTLYAIGGQAGRQIWNTVEAYNAHHDAWVQLPGHMGTERKYTSAGVLHGENRNQLASHQPVYTLCDHLWYRIVYARQRSASTCPKLDMHACDAQAACCLSDELQQGKCT